MDNTNNNLQVAEKEATGLQPISVENIDALEQAEAAPFDLMSDYWSPEVIGEKKRVLFDKIETTEVPDQVTGEVLELECAFFFVKENGQVKRIRNGSKRLVGALLRMPPRTALEIKYLGKKKNKNNANSSDNWSITPLVYAANSQ